MLSKSLFLALAAPALISAAAIPQNDPDNWDNNEENIVGGVAASAGDAPFIVSVQTSSGSHFCGGTLLNANTVLTAAHCAVGQTASRLRVRAGSLNINSGGTLANVASIKIHPNYNNADPPNNDVAIFKLASSIPAGGNIAYATLAASGSDPSAGTTMTVAGWGRTSSGGSAPTALRKVDVPVVSRATCQANYDQENITTAMFCAGFASGGKDSCQGDSGGPIYAASGKTLVGVVSWGYGCAEPNLPGVYANIGTLSSFITSNL